MSLPVKEVYELLKATKQTVNQLLNEPKYILNLLEFNAGFEKMFKRLEFMGGVLEPKSELRQSDGSRRFKPIKSFMGDPIVRGQMLNAKSPELSPDEVTKKQFVEKVNLLFGRLPAMSANALLNSFTIDEDRTVLRGVAKRAGVKNWQDGVINEDFIEDIKIGIGIKNEDAATQARIDANVQRQEELRNTKTTTVIHPSIRILTQEDFIGAPEMLTELGAQVGDQLEITVTGDKILTQAKNLNPSTPNDGNPTLEAKDHHSITIVENKPVVEPYRTKKNQGR